MPKVSRNNYRRAQAFTNELLSRHHQTLTISSTNYVEPSSSNVDNVNNSPNNIFTERDIDEVDINLIQNNTFQFQVPFLTEIIIITTATAAWCIKIK